MIYGYCRVSTTHQNKINQHFAIQQFSHREKINIDKWVEEKISSSKKLEMRKLGCLIEKLQPGDILITTEISRLSRSLIELMRILEVCLNKNCQIWTLKENYRLGDNIQSKVLAFAFGLTAELSKQLLHERVKESLERLKKSGKKLGRPSGSKNQTLKLEVNHQKIINFLEQGKSKSEIAHKLKVDRTTLHRYLILKSLNKKESAV